MSSTRKVFVVLGAIFATFVAIVILLLLIATGRALNLKEIPSHIGPMYNGKEYAVDDDSFRNFAQFLCGAIKFKTVATAPGDYNRTELLKLKTYLRNSFPIVFNSDFINVEDINTYSFLLTVEGSNSGLKPFMLASHLDVVPVDEEKWTRDPFLGEIVTDSLTGDKVIWGRGAIDDKTGVVGILSAVEFLISKGWKPTRSFFIGFGHDEEVSGFDGAGEISKVLTARNVSLDFLVDEGLPITLGIMPGMDAPVATIGISEKGRMNVKISVDGVGGHSSIPPKEQAVGILSGALKRLYDNPQPSMFGRGPEKDMLKYLAPKASWPNKLLLANTWLFGPVIGHVMSQKRESDALLRTSTAITMVRAGVKDNVVPSSAWALVNHRVHPAQTLDQVLEHDRAVVADSRVKVERLDFAEPHPLSPYGSDSIPYSLVADAVKHAYPQAVPVPSLMIGNTDTGSYLHLTDSIYRMYPFILTPRTIGTIHGHDEFISEENFRGVIKFYIRLILSSEVAHLQRKPRSGREEL